jgi:hypothetical protein
MHDSVSGRDVVVAIIGGTLLGLALTRPRLGWAQRLEESYRWSVEVVTTIVAFVMGGYAYGALFVVLHRQLGGDIDKLLRTAAVLIGVYAALVHFEPFADGHDWRERGSAIFLYLTIAITSVFGGVVLVEYTLTKAVHAGTTLIAVAALMVVAWGFYVFTRRSRPGTMDSEGVEGEQREPLPVPGKAR